MVGENPEGSPEEEFIPEEPPEEEEYKPLTRRGRKKQTKLEIDKDLEEELKKLDGSSLIKVLNFLHKTYLSWITEAEAEKYYTVSTRAFDEALRRQEKTIAELSEQFSRVLTDKITPVFDTLDRRLEALEKRIESVETKAGKPAIDDRLIAIGLMLLDSYAEKNQTLKELRPLIRGFLGETARKYLMQGKEEEEKEEGEESNSPNQE